MNIAGNTYENALYFYELVVSFSNISFIGKAASIFATCQCYGFKLNLFISEFIKLSLQRRI